MNLFSMNALIDNTTNNFQNFKFVFNIDTDNSTTASLRKTIVKFNLDNDIKATNNNINGMWNVTESDLMSKYRPNYLTASDRRSYAINAIIEYREKQRISELNIKENLIGLIRKHDLLNYNNRELNQNYLNKKKLKIHLFDNYNRKYVSKVSSGYSYAFDGVDFVEFDMDEYRFDTEKNIVVVSDGTKVMNARSIHNSLCKIDLNYNNFELPNIHRYNGVAECVKTKKAIDIVKEYPDDCMVLTATRSAAADLRERISTAIPDVYEDKELKMRFRTLDSLLVGMHHFKTNTKHKNFKILIIDECYMMNLGGLLAAMVLTEVNLVICIGDRFQLPYIERDRMVTFQYDYRQGINIERRV